MAVQQAGIENFRFHDLRHTALSYAAQNGASLLELQELAGHKTPAMVLRYAHLDEKANRKTTAGIAARIKGES